MVLKLKKIFLIMLAAAFLFVILSVPALADTNTDLVVTSVNVGSVSVPFSSIPLDYGGMYYMPMTGLLGADFYFNNNSEVFAGDVITVSYKVRVPSSVSSFFFALGGARYIPPASAYVEVDPNAASSGYYVSSSFTYTSPGSQSLPLFCEVGLSGNEVNEVVYLEVCSISYSVRNDPSYAANSAANDIKNNQDKNTDKTLNEDYGYQSPDSSTTDEGISSGTNLVESLNTWIDEFNAELPSTVSRILDAIEPVKAMVHKIFNVFPAVLQYLVTFAMVFLVLRKVIGR